MRKKLKRRFIAICMCSVSAIIVIVLGTMNISTYMSEKDKIIGTLNVIIENDGSFPGFDKFQNPKPPENAESDSGMMEGEVRDKKNFADFGIHIDEETRFRTRYFFVRYNTDGSISEINTDNIAAITEDAASEYSEKAVANGKESGKNGNYYYRISSDENGKLVVFLDCTNELSNIKTLMVKSCVVAASGLIVLFIIITCLSARAIKPFAENMEKQKRFITDASHEIKTPIAIISANADVLMLSGDDNEWVKNIKHQTSRLSGLVNDLVTLSTLDEESDSFVKTEFSLSDTTNDSVEQFRTLAEIEGKTISSDIQPDIKYKGNEKSVSQLMFILLDNAIKYSLPDSEIKVSLKQTGKNNIFKVSNLCEKISKEDLRHIFDRFYRADQSRSRETGGYGIGLSLAKAIAENHQGSISASTEDEKSVTFTVTF